MVPIKAEHSAQGIALPILPLRKILPEKMCNLAFRGIRIAPARILRRSASIAFLSAWKEDLPQPRFIPFVPNVSTFNTLPYYDKQESEMLENIPLIKKEAAL
jgi:hypothetical protein